MKRVFLSLAVFVFINARSQVNDSMQEMETTRLWNESWMANVLGKAVPDFTATDLDGKTYTKNIVSRNKATFINFWFVSCAPCIAEIPNLNRLYTLMKDSTDFQFFAITHESEASAKEAIKKYDIHFPVLLVSYSEAHEANFGRGFPTSMVLDKEGKVHAILSGGSSEPGHGWNGFELYWKQEIEKVLRGDSLIESAKPAHSPVNKSGIFFIDSLAKIQSLDALTKHFKGQSLFIDVWASWCLPCLQEFTSKNSVDSFLDKHKIARVFISLDNPKNPKAEETWQNLVYQYQLKGYHLIAGKELMQDLKQKISMNNALEIPRYIIVKNGKIVELNALHPSDDQKLVQQLTEKLF